MRNWIQNLKTRAITIKQEVIVISYALADGSTPATAKIMAFITVGYMLSPIDLVPDFIPVLGLLDDLVLVPLMISYTLKLIPDAVIRDIRTQVDLNDRLEKKWYFAVPVILIYLFALAWIYIKFFKHSL